MSLYDDASLIMYPSGYKSGKIYSQKPTDGTGDLTFTRASTATRVNADGLIEDVASGVPRIDYTGGGCGKLLLEPQRTNTLQYSEEFDNAYFTTSDVTVSANAATSPDATTSADKIIPNTSDVTHSIYKTSQAIAGGYYSVFAKSDGYDWILLTSHPSVAPDARGAYFNLSNGTIGSQGNGIVAQMEDFGNGWYRCIINAGTSASSIWSVMVANANDTISFAGNGTDGVLIWGGQNEQGSYPTSYIPTSGAAVTRVKDASITSGVSSIIGQAEGSCIITLNADTVNSTQTILDISDNSSSDRVVLQIASTKFAFARVSPTDTTTTITSSTILPNTTYKLGFVYSSGRHVFYVNGVKIGEDANTITALNLFDINLGSRFNEGENFSGTIQDFMLFPTSLSDTELETLTTI